jgi:hypothetical protein
VENKKPGRPKSDKPVRNKSITIKVTEDELRELKNLCYEERIAYVDVLLKGLRNWSKM